MPQELDGEKIVENIEKYGHADGDPNAAPEPVASPEEKPAEPVQETPQFNFKSMEDLLKHQLEYAANGKQVKEDLQTILKRASQGYNYAQEMGRLTTERAGWETKVKTAEELHGKWGPYDEYAKKNPEWYQHWQKAWESRGQNPELPQSDQGNIEARLNAILEQKLQPVNELLSSHEQRKQQEALEVEDRQLDSDVKSIREKYKDLDFDATDPESGKSLEFKVLEFMSQNNMKSFTTAFKAFYHDELVKREVEKAKADKSSEIQGRTKAGIIDPKSTSGKRAEPNLKGMNWDQLTDLAAKSLNIN